MASSGIQLAQADAPPLFRGQPTKPALCKVTGACLSEGAIARELATFTIEAYDETGKRQTHGGDNFLVAIRGRGAGEKVRAKIIDNQDGQYAGASSRSLRASTSSASLCWGSHWRTARSYAS
jgi:Filamin/ABP280 repeat